MRKGNNTLVKKFRSREKSQLEKAHSIYHNINSIYKEKKEKHNNERSELRKNSQKKTPFDWKKINKGGKQKNLFNPNPAQREKMISVLDIKKTRSVEREALISILGQEFGNIYERYRRALQREEGKRATWLLSVSSKKHACLGGERCIRKGVTPTQVLKYWHEHVDDLCDKTFKIPPLTFISSNEAIETVSCNIENEKENNEFGNSFASINQLEPKLRKKLQEGGFKTNHISDEYLLQIQHAALAMSECVNFYVSGEIRKMAKYLSEHFFGENK